ncbi:DNA protecting protein DprA [Shimia isoporae]|uniref:DNA protecting protein DprA n=1 Tax=Shimia isoporae TaxID=647720 RepID=A0A4R1NL08_9RHOB|nr:DNA-processing protein DprA [Shimia isoporae]TCL08934.1 DNA protecting protein DprA [Shimia isoporae]
MTEDHNSSTHPQLPPTTEDERFLRLRLLRSRRVGPTTFHRLLDEHGSAAAALDALPAVARAAGVDDYVPCPHEVAAKELKAARSAKARAVFFDEPDYPSHLATISDAPPMLWLRGDRTLLKKPMIAIVGARNASALGNRTARALSKELAENGFVIVSGLARGIDASAHRAALKTGTIAVFAGGIDVIYPAENSQLGHDIAAQGLCISEHPPGLAPRARHFPSRNRIVSGLARAVVVVEAAAKSGSLITARTALDQGREVLAVPGHPFDARASGCNLLIRDGAPLVRNAEDVIEALSLQQQDTPPTGGKNDLVTEEVKPAAAQKRNLRETHALHLEILNRLGPTPIAEDQLIRDIQADAEDISPALLELELEGQITRQSGGLLSRN